jgi:hypothetical protein
MNGKPSDREQRAFDQLVERLRFWGYEVPAGEKQIDPALLLMLRAFAHHTVATEDKLARASDSIVNTLISDFFVTGLKRPVPAFTILSCESADKHGTVDIDTEFTCQLPGTPTREYSFFPLYPQTIHDVNCDVAFFVSGDHFRVLKASSDESESWEAAIDDPEYLESKRGRLSDLGGAVYVGLAAGVDFKETDGLQLYLGPEWETAKKLMWLEWQILDQAGGGRVLLPGRYHNRLEIFKYLDVRELEIEASYQSRLYSSDFLTSGKLLWHFKHYLAPSKCFAFLPREHVIDASRMPVPEELSDKFDFINFADLKTPRIWLKIELPPDQRVTDPRQFQYFDTNAFPAINRRKSFRNKYTMGQEVLEINLFALTEDEQEHAPEKLFSIDRVWDSNDQAYVNYLDLDSFGNPHKYMISEEENTVKLKFDFTTVKKEPPDYVVVEFSETEGSGGNGIGSDIEFILPNPNPQIASVRSLITSQGGSNAKSPEQIKRLTGFFLRNHGVALAPGEIEYLARNFDSRIGKVEAAKGVSRTPGGLLPSVIVDVTLAPEAELSSEERGFLLERLTEYLDSYTPVNLYLETRWAGEQ